MRNYIFFVFLFVSISSFAQWEQVGSNFGYTSRVPSIAFDPITSEPYIAYVSSGYRIDKFDGTNWMQIGANLGFFASNAGVSLTFNPSSNEPYVAFNDNALNQFEVHKFDNSSWVNTGNISSSNYIFEIDIAFHPITNEPYLAFTDEAGSFDEIVVMKFSNNSWSFVGLPLEDVPITGRPSIAFNPATNEPYVAYSWNSNFIAVKKFNGVDWVSTGSISGTPGNYANISLAFNASTNEPFIAFVNNANNTSKYEIQKFNGSNWVQVGSNPGSSDASASIRIVFNPLTNEPYIAYPDNVLQSFIVQKFDGSNWSPVGLGLGNSIFSGECAIAFNPTTNEPYLGYFDNSLNSLIVQKFVDPNLGLESSTSLPNTIALYPNPSSDFIKVSGLSKMTKYTTYGIVGNKINNGTISNDGIIDIKNFTNGVYFLQFENGITIKFIKK